MTCGFSSFVRAPAFLLGVAVVASPIDASATEHVSMGLQMARVLGLPLKAAVLTLALAFATAATGVR
jgi:hypothetical protein